jgi:hypothetical protein
MVDPSQEKEIISNASKPLIDANPYSPPPEKVSTVWTRRFIIFAFWAVVATLGLPHWIWTTSIHRSELPVEKMTSWAEGNVGVFSLFMLMVCADVGCWLGVSTSISDSCGVGG